MRLSLLTVLAVLGTAVGCTSAAPTTTAAAPPSPAVDQAMMPAHPARICGQRVLDSPYRYNGAPGKYASGTPGLPTYGRPKSDFPAATAGVVLPPGKRSYAAYQLAPKTVYYLLPGAHIGSLQADAGDAFVGGLAGGVRTVLSGEYSHLSSAIDSNYSNGNQPHVTIEYLTIQKYQPIADAAAINQSSNTDWTLRSNTITLNSPGAGLILGANNTLESNCLTLNGQYGFQSSNVSPWGHDSLTGGPYNVTIEHNEVSYNDTCDFEGLLNNPQIGWKNYDPVPSRYRNSHCGKVVGDGNQGGFKLWRTNGVSISDNYIHDNWGPGIWADTDNANTAYAGNVITDNDGQAIIEEISYNFAIRDNYVARNGWAIGLSNPHFPTPAFYISESGSPQGFGGVPACREASCAGKSAYTGHSIISGNVLVDNGGGVFLWQNSDRYCGSGFDGVCTLVGGGTAGPFTLARCGSNLRRAAINPVTYTGRVTGSPREDWWDGCLWKTENVSVTKNVVDFNPAAIPHCDKSAAWRECGANGMYSEYSVARPYMEPGGWMIATQLTFHQGNTWQDNVYNGPSTFYGWNQGNIRNPVGWSKWTGEIRQGDMCDSLNEHQSGDCTGPFGQDSGSTFRP